MGFFDVFGKKKQSVQDISIPDMSAPEQAPGGDTLTVPSDIAPIHAEHLEMQLPPPPNLPEQDVQETAPEPVHIDPPIPESSFSIEPAHTPLATTFISVSDYKIILGGVNNVKTKLSEADSIVERLGTIKTQEEQFFERWRNQLEEIERKINAVDQIIGKR